MKTIKVIIIDTMNKVIKIGNIDVKTVESLSFKMEWARLMGSDEVDEVLWNKGDMLYINTKMLFTTPAEKLNYFSINDSNVFGGDGMIVGVSDRGLPTDVNSTIEELESKIHYHNHYDFSEQLN